MPRTKSQKSPTQHSQRTRSKTKKASECVNPDYPEPSLAAPTAAQVNTKVNLTTENTHSSTPRMGVSHPTLSSRDIEQSSEFSIIENDNNSENNSESSDLHSCSEEFSENIPETDLPYLGNVTIPQDKSPQSPQALLVDILKAQNKDNLQLMRELISTSLKETSSQIKEDIKTQLSEVKSDLSTLIEKQQKEFQQFKNKIDERITGLHGMIKNNDKTATDKISTLENKVTDLSQKITSNKKKLPELVQSMNSAVINQCIENKHELEERLSKLEKQNPVQLSNLTDRMDKLETRNKEYAASLNFFTTENDSLKKEIENLKEENSSLHEKINHSNITQGRFQTDLNDTKQQLCTGDVKQRKLNLIFEGIAEVNNEYPKDTIFNLINNAKVFEDIPDFDTAYRLGKYTNGQNRPILVSFYCVSDKDLVLHNAARIKKGSGIESLWINRDHPEITRRQIANTRRCYNLTKLNNHDCQLHGTSITYKNKVYHYKDLNSLPEGSRLEDTRLVPCDDGRGVCFQGDLAYLSNRYPVEFIYKHKPFLSAEQAFQWEKALNAGETLKAHDILHSVNAFKAKNIGDSCTPSPQWDNLKCETLTKIVYQKFAQNKSLKKRLINSEYTSFYECTRDSFWGVNYKITSREIDTKNFTGLNTFGIILADLKKRLINESVWETDDSTCTKTPLSSTKTPDPAK